MQKLMKAIHQNEKGFTLVELMVVVVIIGILIAIAIPLYGSVQATAREKACFANQRTIDGVIAMFLAEGGVTPPTNADDFAAEVDNLGPYLMAAPRCPNATTDQNYTISGTLETGYSVDACPADPSHGSYS